MAVAPPIGVRAGGPLPDDPALPGLATLLDGEAMATRLASVWPGRARITTELLRHKPGRRAVIRYTAGDRQPAVLYGKTFASERGRRVHRTAEGVFAAHRAGALPFVVAEPVAWLPELRLSLLSGLSGSPVGPRLLAGNRALARHIAEGLVALHGSGLVFERRHGPTDELAPLAERVERLGRRAPQLGVLAAECLNALARRCDGWERSWRSLPIHRDCYHEQWLVDSAGLKLLDFDDAKRSEPALDIANVAAHLRLLALQRGRTAAAIDRVVGAFLDAAHASDPALSPVLVRELEAATLLRIAEIHQSRANGDAIGLALLDLCAARLTS